MLSCVHICLFINLSQLKLGNKLKTNSELVAAGTQYGELLGMAVLPDRTEFAGINTSRQTCVKTIGDGQTIDHLITNLVKAIVFSPL